MKVVMCKRQGGYSGSLLVVATNVDKPYVIMEREYSE